MALNLTPVSDLVSGISDIMPSLVDLVVAIAPVIVVMAFIGFFVDMFDAILGTVKGGFKRF